MKLRAIDYLLTAACGIWVGYGLRGLVDRHGWRPVLRGMAVQAAAVWPIFAAAIWLMRGRSGWEQACIWSVAMLLGSLVGPRAEAAWDRRRQRPDWPTGGEGGG